MAALASAAYPRIVSALALVGLTLVAAPPSSQPPSAERVLPWPGAGTPRSHPDVIGYASPEGLPDAGPAMGDARPWNHGGMVIAPPSTADRVARNALSDLLSGLMQALGGLGA